MFEPFILKFESDLRSYCRMLTGTPWDADDLYQDTMMKALKAQEKLLAHPAPRAFLFRIASNAWIDECRKRKADVGLPDGYEALAALGQEQDAASKAARLSSKNTEEQVLLIRRFLAAFRLREPMAIASAYRHLTRAGIRAERLSLRGKLHFTFYDPEGNAFTVIAE
jgi:RNA polymerase sigma-70 factor (ECF subfamily)